LGAAQAEGGWDNKYLLFQTFLDQVTAKAAAEVQARWIDELAGATAGSCAHRGSGVRTQQV